MKKIVSISLGPDSLDYNFRTRFLGESFQVSRTGTDGDAGQAAQLVTARRDEVDALGLGMVREHYTVGTDRFIRPETRKLEKLAGDTPITTGARLREIVQEWTVRSAQLELGNIFNNAKVLFLSGTLNYRLASILSEYTDNLTFADPVAAVRRCPTCCTRCARWSCTPPAAIRCCAYESTARQPGARRSRRLSPVNHLKKVRAQAGGAGRSRGRGASYEQLAHYTARGSWRAKPSSPPRFLRARLAELSGRKGVSAWCIDCSIQPFKHTVGLNAVEAMIMAALDKKPAR